jgi:hypothetical protein
MTEPLRDCLLGQLDTAWKLASYHLDGLTLDDCLWRPSERGPHVHQIEEAAWVPDWPPDEDYCGGPASIAWISWHIMYWWSMALDHNFGSGSLERDDVGWPGDADGLRLHLARLHDQWRERLASLDDTALQSSGRVRWPFRDRPLADLFAWANIELTKNAAEIGYVRFLRSPETQGLT